MSDRQQEIRAFLCDEIDRIAQEKGIDVPELDDGFNLLESGLVDSIGLLDLLTAVENRFSIQVDFSDLDPEEFTTLGGLAASLAKG